MFEKILLVLAPPAWPKLPPIGLGYLQSFLLKHEIPASILDLNNIFYNLCDETLKKQWLVSRNTSLEKNIHSVIRNRFTREYEFYLNKILSYDMLGFSCFKSNFSATQELAQSIKSKRKDIRIILGGPEITRQYFKSANKFPLCLKKAADFLVAGEGERPLLEYLKGGRTEPVAVFEQAADLSALPFPVYWGLDFSGYPRKDAYPLQFSRGCIRKCAFCSERLLYQGFRTREADSVIEEMRYHRKKNKIKYFVFFDSLINADIKKLEELCDKIIANFGTVNWEAQIAIRTDMPQRVFEKMKQSGCYNLFVGLESGCDNTLKNMRKGFSTLDALNFFRQLNRAGLYFGISMIVGYPGESAHDFRKSLDFILKNKEVIPKIEQVNPFTYYDGTAADKKYDYKTNKHALERLRVFVEEIKRNKIKHTNAFLGNLIEKNAGV